MSIDKTDIITCCHLSAQISTLNIYSSKQNLNATTLLIHYQLKKANGNYLLNSSKIKNRKYSKSEG